MVDGCFISHSFYVKIGATESPEVNKYYVSSTRGKKRFYYASVHESTDQIHNEATE